MSVNFDESTHSLYSLPPIDALTLVGVVGVVQDIGTEFLNEEVI